MAAIGLCRQNPIAAEAAPTPCADGFPRIDARRSRLLGVLQRRRSSENPYDFAMRLSSSRRFWRSGGGYTRFHERSRPIE